MWIRNAKSFWTGVLYLVVGLGAVVVAQEHPMGSLSQMGPAYFPTVVGGLLAFLGVVIIGVSFLGHITHVGRVDWRRVWPVMCGPMIFAVTLPWVGLFLSLFLLGMVVRFATHDAKFVVTLGVALAIALFISLLFVGVMGLQVPLFPQGW